MSALLLNMQHQVNHAKFFQKDFLWLEMNSLICLNAFLDLTQQKANTQSKLAIVNLHQML